MNHILLVLAASVTLIWDRSPSPDILLYRVYTGIQSMLVGNPPLTGNSVTDGSMEFTVTGLDFRTLYYFVVTAINGDGLESGYSNELQYKPEPRRHNW
jgi:hypothetical protein